MPVSLADQCGSAVGLVFVPVADLSPSEVIEAWPDTSRSRAVAAVGHTQPTPALA